MNDLIGDHTYMYQCQLWHIFSMDLVYNWCVGAPTCLLYSVNFLLVLSLVVFMLTHFYDTTIGE